MHTDYEDGELGKLGELSELGKRFGNSITVQEIALDQGACPPHR